MHDHVKLQAEMDNSFPGWERNFCDPQSLAEIALTKDERRREALLWNARHSATLRMMDVIRAALWAGIVKLPD